MSGPVDVVTLKLTRAEQKTLAELAARDSRSVQAQALVIVRAALRQAESYKRQTWTL